jgi:hypothetical protein
MLDAPQFVYLDGVAFVIKLVKNIDDDVALLHYEIRGPVSPNSESYLWLATDRENLIADPTKDPPIEITTLAKRALEKLIA